ncbi:MAG: ribosome biogenesis GTP-binding protein YihA/YsxC [Christensenellales bacterium]
MKSCEYIKGCSKKSDFLTDDKFEVCLIGRSNCGKSSLINAIFNNNHLARTSSSQGKTRLVNYFLVDKTFYLVDLPGYGFHLAGKEHEKNWSTLIEDYFAQKESRKLILLLLDIRHSPSEDDKQMLRFLNFYSLPFKIIATKSDKIAKSKRNNQKLMLAREMNVGKDDIIYCSSETKENIDQIKNLILEKVKNNEMS